MSTRKRSRFALHMVTTFLCMLPFVPANTGTNWCQRLNISWLEKPPYVTALSATHMTDEIQLSGAFRYPLVDVLTKCCANSKSKTPLFMFRKANSSKELLRRLQQNETHAALPYVFNSTTRTYREQYRFIPLFDHPGTEYYTEPVKNEPTGVLMDILFSSWPLFAFTFSLTAIAGIVIWATDTFWNANEFPRSFVRGAWEGLWWSYISMTTVGYGDKAPKSFLARILAVAWIQIGLVVTAIFMANITTALTSMPNEKDYNLEIINRPVAVLRADTAAIEHAARLQAQVVDYGEFEEIRLAMNSGKVSGFIMDRYEAGYYFREHRKLSSKLTGALRNEDPLSVGLLIGNGPGTEWPAQCLERLFIELHHTAIAVQETFKKTLHHSQSRTKTFNLFSNENVTTLMEYTKIIALTLAAMIVLGLVWDVFFCCTKSVHRLMSKRENTVAVIELSKEQAAVEISELRQILVHLQSSVEKLETKLLETTEHTKRMRLSTSTTHI